MNDYIIALDQNNSASKDGLKVCSLKNVEDPDTMYTYVESVNYELLQRDFWKDPEFGILSDILKRNESISPFIDEIYNPVSAAQGVQISYDAKETSRLVLCKKTDHSRTGVFKTKKHQKVFGCGDIHGDSYVFRHVLCDITKCCKIGKSNAKYSSHLDRIVWKKGCDHFVVFCGDIVDRMRPRISQNVVDAEDMDIHILETLFRLDNEAKQYGGRVLFVIGNHELINFSHRFTYVPVRSRTRKRESLFTLGSSFAKKISNHAFLSVCVNDHVFVHGGFTMQNTKYTLSQGNRMLRKCLRGEGDERFWKYISRSDEDGPLWNRSWGGRSVQCGDLVEVMKLLGLERPGSKKIVVAHCPQHHMTNQGINQVCSDKVWRIDIAMSRAFDYDTEYLSTFVQNALEGVYSKSELTEYASSLIDDFENRIATVLQLYPNTELIKGVHGRDYYTNVSDKTTEAGLHYLNLTRILHRFLDIEKGFKNTTYKDITDSLRKRDDPKSTSQGPGIRLIQRIYEKSKQAYDNSTKLKSKHQNGGGGGNILFL